MSIAFLFISNMAEKIVAHEHEYALDRNSDHASSDVEKSHQSVVVNNDSDKVTAKTWAVVIVSDLCLQLQSY